MKSPAYFLILVIVFIVFVAISYQNYKTNSFVVSGAATAIISIDPEYLEVSPGEEILSQITIYQVDDMQRKDVLVVTSIKSDNEEIVYQNERSIALDTSLSFVSYANLPKDSNSGTYLLLIDVFDIKSNELIAHASQRFFVKSSIYLSPANENVILIWFLVIILIVIAVLFLIILIKYSRDEEFIKKSKLLRHKK